MKKILTFIVFLSIFLIHSQLQAKSSVTSVSHTDNAPIPHKQNPTIAGQPLTKLATEKTSLPALPAVHNKPETKPTVSSPTAVAASLVVNCTDGTLNVQFLCLLNNYRLSNGLNQLSDDPSLDAVATAYSTSMNATQIFSHIGANGSKFYERCQQLGATCDAENLAKGYTSAQKLFDAWKKSPDHNANMLGDHTITGLSLVGIYATSLFR